ncbi:hypothetical protein JCGZ_08273 [Jatropha curcas]|uniref:Uncharacterized protein n=1 Tax=Jatropha curcas TaxID=180498 RepID=A0A067KMS5_JATCU|nr:hypothetical protein JCGZ_08273 [Jatropha curcas]
MTGPLLPWLTSITVLMYGTVVVVNRTGSSSDHWRCGPTSTASIQTVRVVILWLTPGGSLGIWHTAIIPLPLLLTPWEGEAWRTYSTRGVAELYTRSRLLPRGYWVDRYFLGERVYEIQAALAQRRVPHAPPRHMCLLEVMTAEDREEGYDGSSADSLLSAGDYPIYFSTRVQARLPEVREYTQERKKHRTAAYYRAEAEAEAEAAAPAGPAGAILGDVPFPPGMEVVLDPALGLRSAIIIPADLRQAPPPLQLDPEHATHVPAQRYQKLCRRIWRLGDCAVSPVQRCFSTPTGGDRLRTRLEVEGIPLDFSKEDDDGSSSDDAPSSPPPQAAAGPSQRRR